MTGPEHYKEAERLVKLAADGWLETEGGYQDDEPPTPNEIEIRMAVADGAREDGRFFLAMADVHATLALAAATALNDGSGGMTDADHDAWRRTAGERS